VRLTVYVPGVDDSAVEIEGRGADLTVLARKERVVRPNFEPLHLEAAQRDYLLRLRLGAGYDFSRMEAELVEGVLTVLVPRRSRTAAHGLAA
jgi:HSP20 family molecular chaperone IbpA